MNQASVNPAGVDDESSIPANPYFLESVDRVMRVLDSFTTETPELRLTDLSDLLALPKPQVMRIASTLESGHFLERDPETKRYRLGLRILALGAIVQSSLNLTQVAQPFVEALANETHETIALFAPDHQGAVCIDVRQSPMGLRVFAQPGRRMPWNAGASGKVVLAHLPEAERERILETATFRRYTSGTITDPQQFSELLDSIRSTGFHVAVEDLDGGALGIGAPIFNHQGQLAGALSLAAPVSRAPEDKRARLIELVTASARDISVRLGHHVEGEGLRMEP